MACPPKSCRDSVPSASSLCIQSLTAANSRHFRSHPGRSRRLPLSTHQIRRLTQILFWYPSLDLTSNINVAPFRTENFPSSPVASTLYPTRAYARSLRLTFSLLGPSSTFRSSPAPRLLITPHFLQRILPASPISSRSKTGSVIIQILLETFHSVRSLWA